MVHSVKLMPVTRVLERMVQEDCLEFGANLGYI